LVVITIIGILASLLLPALSRVKATARETQCKSNLRQIGIALLSYTSEHGAYPQFLRAPSISEPRGGKWHDDINMHLNGNWTNGVYRCPTYRGPALDYRTNNQDIYLSVSFGSYGYNVGSADSTGRSLYGLSGEPSPWLTQESIAVGESEVQSPSDMIAIGDSFSRSYMRDPSQVSLSQGLDFLARRMNSILFFENPGEASRRHREKSQNVFADGHVEIDTLSNLFSNLDEKYLKRWHRDNEPHAELFR